MIMGVPDKVPFAPEDLIRKLLVTLLEALQQSALDTHMCSHGFKLLETAQDNLL